MINEKQAKLFCGEDLSAIENYEQAVSDKSQTWDCHHRLEIMPWGTYTVKNLKDHGLYYGQPAASLVFMTHAEHIRLHMKGKPKSEKTKRKLSEARRGRSGRSLSEEAKLKISESLKGRPKSEETKQKLSEAHKGRPNGWTGKRHSEEARRKMSESRREYWRKRKEKLL